MLLTIRTLADYCSRPKQALAAEFWSDAFAIFLQDVLFEAKRLNMCDYFCMVTIYTVRKMSLYCVI